MKEMTVEFQPQSEVLKGLTEKDIIQFLDYLAEEEVCWGSNAHSLISATFLVECVKEYAEMVYGVDELSELVSERITTNFIDLEN